MYRTCILMKQINNNEGENMFTTGDKVRVKKSYPDLFWKGDVFEITDASDGFVSGKKLNDVGPEESVVFCIPSSIENVVFEKLTTPTPDRDSDEIDKKELLREIEELDLRIACLYDEIDKVRESFERTQDCVEHMYDKIDDVTDAFQKLVETANQAE